MTKTKLTFASLLTVGVLALSPAVASAVTAHRFEKAFGSAGEGAGQLQLAAPVRGAELVPVFSVGGSSVAVNDATHNVYVANTGDRRIDEYEADGYFMQAFGANVGGAGEDACIATCKAGTAGCFAGELQAPRFIAVDNAPGLSHGDVYVGDGVGSEAANELQFVEINGATGGTYTLSFEGETTKEIPYIPTCHAGVEGCAESRGPAAKAAQQALKGLARLGTSVEVKERTNSNLEVLGLTVEFGGGLREKVVAEVECDGVALAPAGSSCGVSVERMGSVFVGEVVSKFTEEGTLVSQLDGAAAPDGPFKGGLDGLAVGASGALWVIDDREGFKFEEDGKYGEARSVGSASASGVAVDAAEALYVVNSCGEAVGGGCVTDKHDLDPSGFALGTVVGEAFADLGGSVEAAAPGCVAREDCGVFGAGGAAGGELEDAAGLAVDGSSGTVYVADVGKDRVDVFPVSLVGETGAASGETGLSARVNGEVNPEGTAVTRCEFQYGTSEGYGHVTPCLTEGGSEAIGSGDSVVKVHADLAGLAGGTGYHFRLHVVNGLGDQVYGEDGTFPTLVTAVIKEASTGEVEVGETSAVVRAKVDPEGVAASCRIEYGESSAYEDGAVACEPSEDLGAGSTAVAVKAVLGDLSGGATYHWRVVVSDVNGTAGGADNTFVFMPGGVPAGIEGSCANVGLRVQSSLSPTSGIPVSEYLPDCRAYELVTPAEKNGALLGSIFSDPYPQISADGSRIATFSDQCFAGAQSCTGLRARFTGVPFEFSRGAEGWQTTALEPPASAFEDSGAFGANAQEETALYGTSSGAAPDTFYAREPGGAFEAVGPISETLPFGPIHSVTLQATGDLSHVVFELSNKAGLWPSLNPGSPLYEYTGRGNTKPFMVDVKGPEGSSEIVAGGCATLAEIGGAGTNAEEYALSVDGSRVFFKPCDGGLYVRVDGEDADAHTVLVSARSQSECAGECAVSPAAATEFEGASETGERVFFTSTQQLTNSASEDDTQGDTAAERRCPVTTGVNGCNLYEVVCPGTCGAPGEEPAARERSVVDVSAGDTSGGGPQVQGVMAVSADGSHVYFVAKGVLAGSNAEGESPVEGVDNLYVYDGHTTFIATLPGDGSESEGGEPEVKETAGWTKRFGKVANVSPDGRFLVFTSHGALTSDATRVLGPEQVYRYDAQDERLLRVSVGERGFDDDGNAGSGGARIVSPGASEIGQPRRDPSMSDDGGMVFFESPVALAPGALNDVAVGSASSDRAQNVYEWEADGEHGCGQAAGCMYLISDPQVEGAGGPGGSVQLLGAAASGNDVFFSTADQLVPGDTNSQLDYYDARVEGGFPAPAKRAGCETSEACHEAGTSPGAEPSLGSQVFTGPGNLAPLSVKPAKPKTAAQLRAKKLGKALKACARDKRKKKRNACERAARKRYGPTKKPKKSRTSKKKGRA